MKKLTKRVILSGHIKAKSNADFWRQFCPEADESKRDEIIVTHAKDGGFKTTEITFKWRVD